MTQLKATLLDIVQSPGREKVDKLVHDAGKPVYEASNNAWTKRKLRSMQLEEKKYLYDIKVACERVARFCFGKHFDDYAADDMLRSAVERQLAIAGEATANLARIAPSVAGRITAHRRIIGFRNILVHGYASVDDKLVWGTFENRRANAACRS